MNDPLSEEIDDNKEIPPPEKVSSVSVPHILRYMSINSLTFRQKEGGGRVIFLIFLLDTGEGEAKQIQ